MLIGSSNFTEAGFMRNIEWNYFTPGEINLAFDNRSAFEQAVTEMVRSNPKKPLNENAMTIIYHKKSGLKIDST
ncbi:MAG: hypothetical protein AB7S77_21905 [Desulfatirhabdiaceae bacterium]